jgi:Flp pilus assembly protein TadG
MHPQRKIRLKIVLGGKRLFFDDEGTAGIEFGLIGTILSLLLLGVVDFGMGYWDQIKVGNAARAGAEYAIVNGWNQSGIGTAVTSATGLTSIAASPAPAQSYGCPSATAGITTASAGSNCAGGGTAGTYVTVSARATYSPIFPFSGFANNMTLTATTVVRIN